MKVAVLLMTFLAATQAREDLVHQLTARAKNHLSARTTEVDAANAEVLEDNTIEDFSDLTEQINEIGLLLTNNDGDRDGSGDDEANFLPDKPGNPIKASKKPGKGSKKPGKGSKKPAGKGGKKSGKGGKKPEFSEDSSDSFISASEDSAPQHDEQPELGPADLEAIPMSLRRYIQALEDRELMRKREEREKDAATAELRSLLLDLTRKRQH